MSFNVARRLSEIVRLMPDAVAVAEPAGYSWNGKRIYRKATFAELEADSNRISDGLRKLGVRQGTRLALLVRPGIEFISLVFALFKSGAVSILIDPGMGKLNMFDCLAEAEPEGFVAIPAAQAVRIMFRKKFPLAKYNVTVGRRWFWGGMTLDQLRRTGSPEAAPAHTQELDPAAIIFTTGSTGPSKGVLFSHGNFNAQLEQIRDFYGIQRGEIDLPAFPLFGLFNCAMGVTAVIPDMDASRPAQVDPKNIIEAVHDWKCTQAFASPAVWNKVGAFCEERRISMPTLRRVLSAGAPVPAHVLKQMKDCIHPEGDVHTPYGATEALPVASIAASEVLRETAGQTAEGRGVCVGRRFAKVEWKIIRIVDGPIRSFIEIHELPPGEIGELIVHGPQVTRSYVTRVEANRTGKIPCEDGVWHRMGDSGYFDEQGRFWFCGRVAHRVLTSSGPMYPIPCESITNQHPDVFRSALVGVGAPGKQRPVMIVEPKKERFPADEDAAKAFIEELKKLTRKYPHTQAIEDFLLNRSFPVDIRHNAKIFREKLAVWAATEIAPRK